MGRARAILLGPLHQPGLEDMMRRMIVVLATVMALVVTGTAMASSQDSGDGSIAAVWIVRTPTWDANGNVYWLNCQYFSLGNGTTWQDHCW